MKFKKVIHLLLQLFPRVLLNPYVTTPFLFSTLKRKRANESEKKGENMVI
jgi:hypothetical protein